ncbi:hypothetical protein [Nitrincola sp.]|uniref:hypothetical protein n=1 Tax=Nitrincola sp. TaxID=1926584 RepID=UPI003A9290B8
MLLSRSLLTVAMTSCADTRILGSNLLADQNLSLNTGNNLTIEAAHNSDSHSHFTQTKKSGQQSSEHKFKQSGLTLAITSPVIEAVETIQTQVKAASNTDSSRMQALAAANIAMNANQAVNAVQAGQNRTDGNLADQADTLFLSAGSDMTLRGAVAVAEAERVQLNTVATSSSKVCRTAAPLIASKKAAASV